MRPEEVEEIIGRDKLDDVIDAYVVGSDDYCRYPESASVAIEIRSGDFCQAIQDMAFEVLSNSRQEFESAVRWDRSSEALTAAYKVAAMRELLRQTLPLRNRTRN